MAPPRDIDGPEHRAYVRGYFAGAVDALRAVERASRWRGSAVRRAWEWLDSCALHALEGRRQHSGGEVGLDAGRVSPSPLEDRDRRGSRDDMQ